MLPSQGGVQASAPFFPRTLKSWPPVSFPFRSRSEGSQTPRPRKPDPQTPSLPAPSSWLTSGRSFCSQLGVSAPFHTMHPSPGGLSRGSGFSNTSELGVAVGVELQGLRRGQAVSPPPHSPLAPGMTAGLRGSFGRQLWLSRCMAGLDLNGSLGKSRLG